MPYLGDILSACIATILFFKVELRPAIEVSYCSWFLLIFEPGGPAECTKMID